MQTNRSSSSRAAPIFLALCGIGLAAATMFAAKTSYQLRHELRQKNNELQQLRRAQTNLAQLASLQIRLDDLENRSAKLREENEQLRKQMQTPQPAPALVAPAANPPASTATNRPSWIERIRQEDPERYKRMQEERDQRRQRVDALMQEQFGRLDERLQAAQTQEEADLINQISATLQKFDELRQKWEALRQLPENERRQQATQLGAESWQAWQTLSDLRAQDRSLQLQHLASQIGYRDTKDAGAFVDSVQRIYDETDVSAGRFMGFGRGWQQQ